MRENGVERADRLGFQREKQRDERREGISIKHGTVCRYSGFIEDGRNQRQCWDKIHSKNGQVYGAPKQ